VPEAEAGQQWQVLSLAREYGMRLVGPNCVGVVNTDPAVSMNATFGRAAVTPGPLGVLSQSGAFGLGFAQGASRAGLGVSQFVSVGNKADVSGNDMLLHWADDPHTSVIGMYLESIKDPARFVRIARRVTRTKPVLLLKSGRTEAGRRAGASHTAAATSSEVAVDALCRAAGVLRLNTTEELIDAARVLAAGTPPDGHRLVIVGNSGGPGILAADAAASAGLDVVELGPTTRTALAAAVPAIASTQNPVDLGAAAGPDDLSAALAVLAAARSADVLLTIFTDVAVTDPAAIRGALVHIAPALDVPIVSVEVGGEDTRLPVPGGRDVPVFSLPERAAAAIGVAARYDDVRQRPAPSPVGPAPAPPSARRVVERAVTAGGRWLDPVDTHALLSEYCIPACPQAVVATAAEACAAAHDLGLPVVLKIAEAGVHKTDVGGVRVGLGTDESVTAAFADLHAISGGPVLMQPMISSDGRELIVGAVRDDTFGPLVMVGAGGTLADVLGDRAFRLAPLTEADAVAALDGLRVTTILDGVRGAPPIPHEPVYRLLVAVGAMVAALPEIAELDLNPVICRPDGLFVVDARLRVAASSPQADPFVRQLPMAAPAGGSGDRAAIVRSVWIAGGALRAVTPHRTMDLLTSWVSRESVERNVEVGGTHDVETRPRTDRPVGHAAGRPGHVGGRVRRAGTGDNADADAHRVDGYLGRRRALWTARMCRAPRTGGDRHAVQSDGHAERQRRPGCVQAEHHPDADGHRRRDAVTGLGDDAREHLHLHVHRPHLLDVREQRDDHGRAERSEERRRVDAEQRLRRAADLEDRRRETEHPVPGRFRAG
jgi:acyl-CoA synthetase (NDP forming)